jgi:hypothetical protein
MPGLPDKPFDSKISVDVDMHGDDVVTVPPAGVRLSLLGPALFIMFWLGGWAVGLFFAVREVSRASTPLSARIFLLAWLGGWTLGGLFAWGMLVSMLVAMLGIERLTVGYDAIVHSRRAFGFTRTRSYPIQQVSGFECRSGEASPRSLSSTARCVMMVGKHRIPVGHGVTDVEAEWLAGALNSLLQRRRR